MFHRHRVDGTSTLLMAWPESIILKWADCQRSVSQAGDDGFDVVTDHRFVGFGGGAVGDEWFAELDAAVSGEGGEDFRVGFLFGEDRAHLLLFQTLHETCESLGAGHLLAVDALDGDRFEAVILAEVAEGGVGGGEFALIAGDAGDLHAGPAFEFVEPGAVGGGVFLISFRARRVGLGEGIGGDGGGAAKEIHGVPPVGVDFVFVVMVVVMVAGAFDGGEVLADFDDFGGTAEDAAQGVEVAFEAHAGGEVEFGVLCPQEVGGGGLEVVGVAVFSDEVDDFHAFAADLAGEVGEQRVQRGDFQLGGVQRKQRKDEGGETAHGGNVEGDFTSASELRL